MSYKNKDISQLGEHLIHHTRENNINTIQELLTLGVDINYTGKYGDTATHIACELENYELLNFLVTSGADLTIKNDLNHTVLHLASLHSSIKCLQYLLDSNVEVNVFNRLNNTPLHFACTNYLLNNISLLLQAGANINLQNINGDTPLHLIFETKFPSSSLVSLDTFNDILHLILKTEPDLEIKNLKNQTVFDLLFINNHQNFIPLFNSYQNHYDLKKSIPNNNSQTIINQKKIKI